MPDNPNPNPNGPENTETVVTSTNTPAPQNGPTAETTDKSGSKEETFSAKFVEELRQEAANYRVQRNKERERIENLEKELKTFQDAQLTEEQRREQELTSLRESNSTLSSSTKDLNLKLAIALAAPDQKVRDIEAAIKLIGTDKIEFNADGSIADMSDAWEDLKDKHSWLFGSGTPTAPNPGTTNPGKAPKAVQVTKADLAKMDPMKVAEMWKSGELNHLL